MVEAPDFEGRPPLHHLVNSKQSGNFMECLKVLLDNGADINQTDLTGRSSVHIAAIGQKAQRLKNLIEKDADLCLKNNAQQSGLHFAMKYLPDITCNALESKFDRSIQLSTTRLETDAETELRMDLNVLMPPISVSADSTNSPRSEVELFTDILPSHQGSSRRLVEKILLHPLSQTYLNLKWAQTQKFYYLLIVLTHLVYSVVFSIYSLSVYRVLCPYNATTSKTSENMTSATNESGNIKCREHFSIGAYQGNFFLFSFLISNDTYLRSEFPKMVAYSL